MMRCLLCFLSLVSVASHAQQGSMVDRFVVSGKDAFFLGPPNAVVDNTVDRYIVSPAGEYVLILGGGFPVKGISSFFDAAAKGDPGNRWPQLKVWDTANDRVNTILLPEKTVPDLNGLRWSSKPGLAFQISYDNTEGNFGMVMTKLSLKDATYRPFQTISFQDWSSGAVLLSPVKPLYIVVRVKYEDDGDPKGKLTKLDFKVYDLDGNLKKQAEHKMRGMVYFPDNWTMDGSNMIAMVSERLPGQREGATKMAVFDPVSGSFNATVEKLTVYEPAQAQLPLTLGSGSGIVQSGDQERATNSLWLLATGESEQPRCLVAAEYEGMPALLPSMRNLIYMSRNRLYSCEIARIDKAVYMAARDAARRTEALMKAKQVGVALAMYSADNNDTLPDQSAFLSGVKPYLKNDKLLEGFVYTYKGGKLDDVTDPSGTEMGYVSVPGGRCVTYVDGHAKFVKDK